MIPARQRTLFKVHPLNNSVIPRLGLLHETCYQMNASLKNYVVKTFMFSASKYVLKNLIFVKWD